MKKRQNTERQDREAEVGWAGLSEGEATVSWSSVYYTQLNGEAELLHTARWEAGLSNHSRHTQALQGSSLRCKHLEEESYGGHFLHSVNICTWGRHCHPSELHPREEWFANPMGLRHWTPWYGCTHSKQYAFAQHTLTSYAKELTRSSYIVLWFLTQF